MDPDKPVGIAASLPDVPKPAEPSRLEPPRPPAAKEPAAAPAEKPKLSDGHMGKKSLSILNYVRGPLAKDIPVPLSHSVNGKSKPWEPFMAEEFAHQFHESVLQSTQKALQKHKGNKPLGAEGCGDRSSAPSTPGCYLGPGFESAPAFPPTKEFLHVPKPKTAVALPARYLAPGR